MTEALLRGVEGTSAMLVGRYSLGLSDDGYNQNQKVTTSEPLWELREALALRLELPIARLIPQELCEL
jgi:hypothetical protein